MKKPQVSTCGFFCLLIILCFVWYIVILVTDESVGLAWYLFSLLCGRKEKGVCMLYTVGEVGTLISLILSILLYVSFSRANPSFSEHKEKGFNLLELMTVLAIISILVTVASVGWSSLRDNRQVEATAGQLRSMISMARMQALSTGQDQYVGVYFSGETVADGITKYEEGQFAGTIDDKSSYDPVTKKWSVNTEWIVTPPIAFLDSKVDGSAPAVPLKGGIRTFTLSSKGVTGVPGESSVLVKSKYGKASEGKVVVINTFTGKVRVDECVYDGMKCQ